MTYLIIGLIVFFAIHSLPMFAGVKDSVVQKLGPAPYQGLFALMSLAGFVLIVIGMARAEFVPVWQPPAWFKFMTVALMIPAIILLPAANMPNSIKRFTAHPMLWGVTLWGIAHLLANGDKASIVLFGSFVAYALVDMVSANRRGAKPSDQHFTIKNNVMVLVAGLVAYVAIVLLHGVLFGVKLV